MRSWIALSAILLGGVSVTAEAACDYPSLVMIPAKDKLSGREEKKLDEAIQKYFAAMKEYVACIQAELKSAGDNPSTLYRNVLVQRNNAAVAEAEAVQKWFDSAMGKDDTEGPKKE